VPTPSVDRGAKATPLDREPSPAAAAFLRLLDDESGHESHVAATPLLDAVNY